ncbi:MAG: hypothetical protein AB7R40_23160 [Nitrospiraceae bacterium]
MNDVSFEALKGLVLTEIRGAEAGSDRVTFITEAGDVFVQRHFQDCCESVSVEEVIGEIGDIINQEILEAYESTDVHENGWGTGTWTFYTIRTNRGTLVIRWLGESNGYYSEAVDFYKEDA